MLENAAGFQNVTGTSGRCTKGLSNHEHCVPTSPVVNTHANNTRLKQRTVLYRIVDAVGRWSMIDVFMISILTALVRMGTLASVVPGPGVVSFCGVVILTMFAAMSFDPRLMWDAAGQPHE